MAKIDPPHNFLFMNFQTKRDIINFNVGCPWSIARWSSLRSLFQCCRSSRQSKEDLAASLVPHLPGQVVLVETRLGQAPAKSDWRVREPSWFAGGAIEHNSITQMLWVYHCGFTGNLTKAIQSLSFGTCLMDSNLRVSRFYQPADFLLLLLCLLAGFSPAYHRQLVR